jgi:hypothetical protein
VAEYNAKAVTLSQNRENKKALDVVNKAIELDPALEEAHENLAKLFLTSSNIREFWRFWMTPKKRLAVQIIHGALAVRLVLYSFYIDSEITTITEEIKDSQNSKTISTTKEHKIPDSYLIVLGLVIKILLVPEIRTVEVGPIEVDLSKEHLWFSY